MLAILVKGTYYVSISDLIKEKLITPEQSRSVMDNLENNIIDDETFSNMSLKPNGHNNCDCDCAQEC